MLVTVQMRRSRGRRVNADINDAERSRSNDDINSVQLTEVTPACALNGKGIWWWELSRMSQ
jgi:hypothetical protein